MITIHDQRLRGRDGLLFSDFVGGVRDDCAAKASSPDASIVVAIIRADVPFIGPIRTRSSAAQEGISPSILRLGMLGNLALTDMLTNR
jgi:hypothetical protein